MMLPLHLSAIQLTEAEQPKLRELLIVHDVPTTQIDAILAGKETTIEVARAGSNTLLQGLQQYELTVRVEAE